MSTTAGLPLFDLEDRSTAPPEEPDWYARMRAIMRRRRMSIRTERTYLHWVRDFQRAHRGQHPAELGGRAVEQYLTDLGQQRRLSAVSQNQALNALLFLYRHVLGIDLGPMSAQRAYTYQRVPPVLARAEVQQVLERLTGAKWLMAAILYGGGLRVSECVALRVQDIDLARRSVHILNSKGRTDRMVPLPQRLLQPLADHLAKVRRLHQRDLQAGHGGVPLPDALYRKYPSASREYRWQFVFPARRIFRNKTTGETGRWHIQDHELQRAVRSAGEAAGITKRVTPHIFRHCFATHLLELGTDIRTIQQLMGHKHIETTMIYLHVTSAAYGKVKSPLDCLEEETA